MHAEVKLFEKSETILFNLIYKLNPRIRKYMKLLKDNLWFLIFQKALLQHEFSTRNINQFRRIPEPMGIFSR